MGVSKYSPVDFLFTCLGLLFLLLDIALDIFAVVSFYQEEAYVCLCILVLFLVGSSILVQAFSWLLYSYEDFAGVGKVETCLSPCKIKLLHVFQLGIYFRHAGVVENSLRSFFVPQTEPEKFAVFQSYDLSLLRLIETFSESAPQLVLMVTIMLQQGELGPVTVLKAIGSASAIALSVTMYHRCMRSFLSDKETQQMGSSVVYFVWNLLLIASRLTALALFASVLPCFIFTHFICSWLVLVFVAWRANAELMDSPHGERLYRAIVGLIWYFSWFSAGDGRTRNRMLLYHGYILADISLLCSLWFWKMSTEIHQSHAITTVAIVGAVYTCGLFCKIIYYKCFHPNLTKEELKGDTTEKSHPGQEPTGVSYGDETDFMSPQSVDVTDSDDTLAVRMMASVTIDVAERGFPSSPAPDIKRCDKRMRKLAENFYS